MKLRERVLTDAMASGLTRLPCAEETLNILDRLELLGIEGDFVECGVWHGTQPILAKSYVDGAGYRPRKYWCFDTFTGMPPPGPYDLNHMGKKPAKPPTWLAVAMETVKHNFRLRNVLDDQVIFVAGMVEDTLLGPLLPERISYLRLDTDFYASTKAALQVLYPRLESGGALVIDDYGWWQGAKRATDEYFGDAPPEMMVIDRSARLVWKP